MLQGHEVVAALKSGGVTHVIWIPDSELGTWEPALTAPDGLPLIRVCREGEAFAVAAGLWLGGKQPVVLLQCTGFFEAGDALRNIVHDLQIPLFFIVGVRSYFLHRDGNTADTCPIFAEPIIKAWQIPYTVLDDKSNAGDLADALRRNQANRCAEALLIAE